MAKRDIAGLLLLDKPSGMSSNRALQIVKRLFLAKKAGHGGCLDPLATGLLPIYFGQATKFCMYSLGASKSYRVTAELGRKTTTGDNEGDVVSTRPVPALTEKDILTACESLTGDIMQVPPMYSALKHQGQPLYKLARQGVTIDRKARAICIKAFSLLDDSLPFLSFDVTCSKGTYIRTLMEDLGEIFGCGATMTDLRRTTVGQFSLEQSVSLERCEELAEKADLETLDQCLIPCESALSHLPSCHISLDDAKRLLKGQEAVLPEGFPEDSPCCLFTEEWGFVGLGERHEDGHLCAKRMMTVQTDLLVPTS